MGRIPLSSYQSFRCKTHVSIYLINQMKTVIKFIAGFTIIPVASMALFVLLNWIISLLFNTDFEALNHSGIWVLEGILVVAFVIIYLTYMLED
jgi:hypothetical protein